MINSITPIYPIQYQQVQYAQPVVYQPDTVRIENAHINKKPLIDRRIIKADENINEFFDKISAQIFPNSNTAPYFSQLLQYGYVSLSSSCYEDLKTPYSAKAVKLNPNKFPSQNCAFLEEYIKDGTGVGVNFNNFKNPIEQIKQINGYFKFRQPSTLRPPAGIALLSINHPKIIDFIKLKDNEDPKDWCFDLSVVMDDKFLSLVDTNQNVKMQDGSELPAREIYNTLLNSMQKTGEPGIVFSNNPNYICDCCNAVELKEGQGMTIAHINLSKFYNPKTNKCDCDYLKYASDMLSHAVKNIDKNGMLGVLGYQELLDKMNIPYGSKEANQVLEDCLTIIKMSGCKMALSPTGTTSRVLKTTPSIEPSSNQNLSYTKEIDTLAHAQKYLEGGISKTIHLKKGATQDDIDEIVRYSKKKNLKGITVFAD
ncbi:MAG: hypothetical protein IJ877_00440 [Candidatus Gastranaerophilales bacterium]|nr:hypothetical protein [Candidatus Gastranaerophilales bacterium]